MAAILLDKTGVPYWATVPIAGAICLGTGFLFGLPALRLEGLYLALATVALAVATPKILKFKGFDYFGIFLIALMYLMPTGAIGIFNFIGIRLRRGAVAKRQS
jgi:branched-chain amino acid transport system permease protein